MKILQEIVQLAATISTISAALVIIIRPLRDKLLGIKKIQDGLKCLLRAKMLEIYYKHVDERKIRQYEYESFSHMYSAYKTLKGNSFVDKIKKEIDEWTVVS